MGLLIYVAALFSLSFVAVADIDPIKKIVEYATPDFLQKQKFFFEILHRVEDPLAFEEWIKLGSHLIIDEEHYLKYADSMKQFEEDRQHGKLLPRGAFFGALVPGHLEQAIGLFNYLYYAKDWATFQQNVCWARIHVNEGMFVYALNLAVTHRHNLKNFILPQIYEIFPQHFFTSKSIYKAEKFNYDRWIKLKEHQKELMGLVTEGSEVNRTKSLHGLKPWQWWKLMGLSEDWHAEEQHIVRDNIEEIMRDPKWSEAMHDVDIFWLPTDYSRDLHVPERTPEAKVSYFLEDIEWNAIWYYLNIQFPHFLLATDYVLDDNRYSEFWMYMVQIFNSRYYSERLSNDLDPVKETAFFATLPNGFNPEMISWNGVPFQQRPNNYTLNDHFSPESGEHLWNILVRTAQTARRGVFHYENGSSYDLHSREGYKIFADVMQGSVNALNGDVFKDVQPYFFMYISQQAATQFYDITPNVLLNYETMNRDPLYGEAIYSRVIKPLHDYQKTFEPYSLEQLTVDGVEITDLDIDELITYFDYTDIDVSNLLNDKMRFIDGQYQWDKLLLARQARLSHKPFTFRMKLNATKAEQLAILIYSAPKYDEHGNVVPLNENRKKLMQIDEFTAHVVPGENLIERKHETQYVHLGDRPTTTELYRLLMLALEGKYDFPLNITAQRATFSRRCFLPKGTKEGFPMLFFFAVTRYTNPQTRYIHGESFGYPFDRRIPNEKEFLVPNFYVHEANVFHIDHFDNYAINYNNYGTFDYNYKEKFSFTNRR